MNHLLVSPSPFLTQGFRLASKLIVAQEDPKLVILLLLLAECCWAYRCEHYFFICVFAHVYTTECIWKFGGILSFTMWILGIEPCGLSGFEGRYLCSLIISPTHLICF